MMALDSESEKLIVVGRLCGVFGVKGWLKVYSFTEQQLQILEYKPWYLKRGDCLQQFDLIESRKHGKGIVVQLKGIHSRDIAAEWVNAEIMIDSEQLPKLPEGEFYWADLTGLKVLDLSGVLLGIVVDFMQTGANDVLVLKVPSSEQNEGSQEVLIPYLMDQVIKKVDLEQQEIIVDWDVNY
ncbi:16S rRNA processing protein RimM [hydrothermal vent metagenome]|uniref:16S rRNA processing protein RimM n=1 Tax=hydrothermal vent metagenome TaxID=652676 RepID=A0A3B0YKW8_9ZZZZ